MTIEDLRVRESRVGNSRLRNGAPDRRQLITAAMAVGDRLEALALRGERDTTGITWAGLVSTPDHGWVPGPLGPDLYDALAGIALFMAYLGKVTREARYDDLARGVLTAIRGRVGEGELPSVGGFAGRGGIIYALSHLGTLWDEPALLAEATVMARDLRSSIAEDEETDIIFGAAGCIGALASLYGCDPSKSVLTTAIECGDRLLKSARPLEKGIGWPTKSARTRIAFRSPKSRRTRTSGRRTTSP